MSDIQKKKIELEDLQGEEYGYFVEEAQSILQVHRQYAKIIRAVGYWRLGERIIEQFSDREYGDGVIKKLSRDIGIDQNTIYASIRFRKRFPEFIDSEGEPQPEAIPYEGELTWSAIKNDVLPESNCQHEETKTVTKVTKTEVCKSCGKAISQTSVED